MNKLKLLAFLELVHIPLWLIKDLCWLMTWKTIGIIIAVPTVLVAIFIVWVTKNEPSKLFPNLSIAFWILANANWMVAEFFELDIRFYSIIPFVLGLMVFGLFMINNLRINRN